MNPRYVTVFTPQFGLSFAKTVAQLCKRTTTNGGTVFYKPILVGTLIDVAELVDVLNERDVDAVVTGPEQTP